MRLLFLSLLLSAEANPLQTLAIAQRNYAAARLQLAETMLQLQQKVQEANANMEAATKEAEKVCEKEGKKLDIKALSCVAPVEEKK